MKLTYNKHSLYIGLILIYFITSTLGACLDETLTTVKYSEWSGKSTTPETTLTINPEDVILLDESTVLFDVIDIKGTLIVDRQADININAHQIYVENGGVFVVGEADEACRIEGNVVFTLHGDKQPDVSDNGVGTKSLGVLPGGTLLMHGSKIEKTWVMLDATAQIGDEQVVVDSDVSDWNVGDEIIIVTTDFEDFQAVWGSSDESQNELRTITGVSADGKTLSFNKALEFVHWGEVWQSSENSDMVDIRGEVALLTRNIKFRGDSDSISTYWGAHIMVLENSIARIESVEITRAGQQGELGRYPVLVVFL